MARRKVTEALLIAEIEGHVPDHEFQFRLDAFRVAVQAETRHRIVLYRVGTVHVREFDIYGANRTTPVRHMITEE